MAGMASSPGLNKTRHQQSWERTMNERNDLPSSAELIRMTRAMQTASDPVVRAAILSRLRGTLLELVAVRMQEQMREAA